MGQGDWDDLTPTAVPVEGDGDAAGAAVKDADGNDVLDFTELAAAEAQAKVIGGTVVPSGVAFHVEKS